MFRRTLVFAAVLALPATALAQTLSGIKVEPAEIRPGDTTTITVSFAVEAAINCGMRLHFGDGVSGDYKINQERDVPLVVTRAYPKPGEYSLMAEPKTLGVLGRCGGRSQNVKLSVVAPPPPPPPLAPPASAKPSAVAGPICPEGWRLGSKSVNKKTGAFTCVAKPGTKVPARVACPGDLGYFENEKKGVLGCRP